MEHLFSGSTGIIHFVFSMAAMVTGSIVLIAKKGTSWHKKNGYVYTASMTGVLITSFMLYNLYGRFGIFHFFALVSTVTLIGGMAPMILKKPKNYISFHLNFMYWSVFGLYGAFMAEVLVRIPKVVAIESVPTSMFYNMVGVAVFITMGFGYFLFNKMKKAWQAFEKASY
ncbi:MAG: hypothetical protein HKN68_08435 [Saprospiraceae bacterium]|nr:hypothetical protein [Saprospiraceae bacterium]